MLLWSVVALGGVLLALALVWLAARKRSEGAKPEPTPLPIASAALERTTVAAAAASATIQPEPLAPAPDPVGALLRGIDAAADSGDYAEAARRAQMVRVRYPLEPGGYERGAAALLRAGQQAAAEALIASGIEKLGMLAPLLDCRAHLAYNYGDFSLAADRFAELRQLFPDQADGYVWGAEALTSLSRHTEAEALLSELIDGPLQGTAEFSLVRFAGYARYRQDWQEAARRWTVLLRHHPASIDGHLGLSEALRHCGEWAEASRVLATAKTYCPDDERIDREAHMVDARVLTADVAGAEPVVTTPSKADESASEASAPFVSTELASATPLASPQESLTAADKALTDGDVVAALGHWASARTLPDAPPEAWLLAARHLGADEAFALLAEAASRFPHIGPVQHDLARAAERRSDLATAEQAWRAFVAAEPGTWWGYVELAETLRRRGHADEADLVLRQGCAQLPDEAELPIHRARQLQMDSDWEGAAVLLGEVSQRWPERAEGVVGYAIALARLHRDDAYVELTAAANRFPENPEPLHDLAMLAERAEDWPAAEHWWRRFVATYPEVWWGHDGLSKALLRQGRFADAEAALEEAVARQPDDPALAGLLARFAESNGNHDLASRRWDDVISRFPDMWTGYGGKAALLLSAGQTEEADKIIDEVGGRFSDNAQALHDIARLAERRRDWAGAEAAWRAFLRREAGVSWGYTGLAGALFEQQRFVEADAVIREATAQLPNDVAISHEAARIRTARADVAHAAK